MRFALVDRVRFDARPRLRGTCPCCGSPVVAKCGRFKAWHWAHESRDQCDSWSEPETEWHRAWKSEFPKEWQEVVHFDPSTREKHIADVRTRSGLVVEFQYSPISEDEMRAREHFYEKLVWIVSGRPGESNNGWFFQLGLSRPVVADIGAHLVRWQGPGRLLHKWADAEKDVYLDFGNDTLWKLVEFNKKSGEGGRCSRQSQQAGCGLQEWRPLREHENREGRADCACKGRESARRFG